MNRREQEKKELSQYPCPEKDDLATVGVLLSDEIEHYATTHKMIDPFDRSKLRAASYELTVGDEYSIGGETRKLHDESGGNEIRIPPFEVIIIQTRERLNLPRFLIARWNLRVKWAYEGLLWVGGPQVDPGWVGHLFCPLYNLSDKEAVLRVGEPIAVVDFVKTTPFKKGESLEYPRPPARIILDDYNPERLKSALITELKDRISEVENKVSRFGAKLGRSMDIIFTVLAIIIAAIAIFAALGQSPAAVDKWVYISVTALIIGIIALIRTRHKG